MNNYTSPAYTFSWHTSGIRGVFSTSNCITVNPSSSTTYSVTVTNSATLCSATTSILVTVSVNVPSFNLADVTSNSSYATISAWANNSATTGNPNYHYMYILEEMTVCNGNQVWIENNNPCYWWNFPNPTQFNNINNSATDYPAGAVNLPTACGTFPVGEFMYGNTYRITLGSWNDVCPWAQSSQCIVPSHGQMRYANGESKSLVFNSNDAPDFSHLQYQNDATRADKIDNDNHSSQISVYPNPTNGNFTVQTSFSTPQQIQVVDITGKTVLSQTISGKTNISADNLPNGIYNVIITGNNKVENKRLIIIR
ncbi:MAG TPA: T9SS type A sorting domain-containing protein [Nitrosopumilaceae archaeon]|nr:T9SS type A sorting domain-containing protein [Nitrosopumilaceae archaeon]